MSHTPKQAAAYRRIKSAIIAVRHDLDALGQVITREHEAWGDLHEAGREHMRKMRDGYVRLAKERAG